MQPQVSPLLKNAGFVRFENFFGAEITETGVANSGDEGVDIAFRTTEFGEEKPIDKIALESNLTAKGSWAMTAK